MIWLKITIIFGLLALLWYGKSNHHEVLQEGNEGSSDFGIGSDASICCSRFISNPFFSWSLSGTMNFVTMIFFYYYYNLCVSMSSIILKNSESNFSRTMINISIINSVISASDAMFWNKRLVYICYACVWIFSPSLKLT